ncbi:MAG: DUF503 domain-containing protein [Acidimicrobiaceae bacterium]|nr:DUF503 domain-containing protein [Acidimicrobiaceae bacterium]MCO4833836.1 DUF503 domain-containing protein [Acidimicrobiaceae bacterium]MDG1088229.1 DUF503 domain-containing protein [Acidimicrobiales bacterium]
MYVLALQVDLRFPSSHSLKQKRMLLKPVIDGLRSRFDASVAEVAHHDTWQRCELGIALVSGHVSMVEKLADQVERFIWEAVDVEVVQINRHWLEIDR